MEAAVSAVASFVALALEGMAILLIALGGFEAVARTVWSSLRRGETDGARRHTWLSFARWLVLGLEFTLAADIVRTAIAPTWNDIGRLGAIALIRTFLSFFLERDLSEIGKPQRAE